MADVQELLTRAAELDKIARELEEPLQGKVDAFEAKQTEALEKFRAKQDADRQKFDDTINADKAKADEARREAIKATRDALKAQGFTDNTATRMAQSRKRGSGSSGSSNGARAKRVPVAETEARILAYLKEHPGSKNGDMAEALDIKRNTLSQRLAAMKAAGTIDSTGERASTTYTAK